MKPWKILEKKNLLERRWLTISEQRVELPNGAIIDEFHVLHTPDWAAVIALTGRGDPGDEIILVEQYRHGLGRPSLELPAGVIDTGEAPLEAAKRELREETGYAADSWHSLTVLAPEPARATQRAHFFVAHGAHPAGPAQPESSEVIAVRRLPIRGLFAEIEKGTMVHAAHIAAVLLAVHHGHVTPR